MLDYAVKYSGVFVTLTTNGTILNEKRLEKLLASGLHMVDVSLDAYSPETYADIRVNGNLEVTRANVLRLLEFKRRTGAPTKIVVSYVEQPQNVHETKQFETYWRECGVDQVVIRRLHSAAGGVPSIARSMRDEQEQPTRYPCLYPWERILLNPRGELAFCPQDWVHGSVIGNYQDTTIKKIWQSDDYKKLRDAHLANDFSCHKFCGQCPDWRQTRWPGEGRSYADLVYEFTAAL
jgi:radical SAM protein with 4Fe4S-binding SPASM domain